ncbi:anti-repressor SinI family protein [Salirhabdus salicampi]|nr:anti-repressor SinI family protein [Salirhabdus salicampi]MCP8615765.1 anti-repressor SinI family protein [Salirhabdus salicampi]
MIRKAGLNLDQEWVELILEALREGISKEEILKYLGENNQK